MKKVSEIDFQELKIGQLVSTKKEEPLLGFICGLTIPPLEGCEKVRICWADVEPIAYQECSSYLHEECDFFVIIEGIRVSSEQYSDIKNIKTIFHNFVGEYKEGKIKPTKKCSTCHKNDAGPEDQICPYEQDLHGVEVKCDCCSECLERCVEDL